MEISNGINNPVNMYGTSTANNYNPAIDNENKIYGSNIFSSEFQKKETAKTSPVHAKKKRRSSRLNTVDTDFLPDNPIQTEQEDITSNFFVEKESNIYKERLKKALDCFFTTAPLFNYFYLKHKGRKIQQTVETLNKIIENADELINMTVPYGEDNKIYTNIAQNLTNAANVIGKANKEF